MMFRNFILIILCAAPLILYGQKKILLGSWIKTKVETVSGVKTAYVADLEKMFFRYTFRSNEQAYMSKVPGDIGTEMTYHVFDDIIDFGFLKMKIESIDSTKLVVIELDNGVKTDSSARIFLTRENALSVRTAFVPDEYFVSKGDTVYFESPKVYSFFSKESIDLNLYLSKFIFGPLDLGELFTYATFIVGPDGKISDIAVHHHIDHEHDRKLHNAIEKTEGMWTPPKVNGKPVKVLKEAFLYRFIESQVVKKGNMTDATVTKYAPKYQPDYTVKFVLSTRQLVAGNYERAVEGFADCLSSTEDDSNLEYQGSICFEKLNDVRNRNICIEKVRLTKLNYLVRGK